MKFGCCTSPANYRELVACGYNFIELSGYEVSTLEEPQWRELVQEFETTGVPCIGFYDYCHELPAIVGDRFDPAAAREYAQRLLDRGSQAHIQNVGIGAPTARRLPAGYPLERAEEQCCRFLEITAEEAAKRNIRVMFEAVHSHMCDFANRTEDAVRIIRKVAAENLFLVLDFYHMEVMGEDPLEIEPYLPYIRHVHVSHCAAGYAREYPGPADLPALQKILTRLRTLGYDGSVSVEAGTENFRADAARSLQILRQAAEITAPGGEGEHT